MRRYFGSAVFDGAEVSDNDYRRCVEQREIAQMQIDGILSGVVRTSVYEVRGAKDACELCNEKIGEIGTMEMLTEKDCVPPFHRDCRCELFEVGYCIV